MPRAPFGEVLRLPGVALLLAVLFLVNFIGRSFTPILPLYVQELGVPVARLAVATGLLISLYSIAAAASAAYLGRASRARSPRALLVATLIGGAVTVLPTARHICQEFGRQLLGAISAASQITPALPPGAFVFSAEDSRELPRSRRCAGCRGFPSKARGCCIRNLVPRVASNLRKTRQRRVRRWHRTLRFSNS